MDFRLLLLLAISFVPTDDVVQSQCDVIEINHVYCAKLIVEPPAVPRVKIDKVHHYVNFYRWRPRFGEFEVIAWRCWCGQVPSREGGLWHYRFADRDRLREIVAPCFRETWTPYDPEVLNRDKFDPRDRPNLPRYWLPP